jgi:hypothetical protein
MGKTYCVLAWAVFLVVCGTPLYAGTKDSSAETDKKSVQQETPEEAEQKSKNWLWETVEEQRKLMEQRKAAQLEEIRNRTGEKEGKDGLLGDVSGKDGKKDSLLFPSLSGSQKEGNGKSGSLFSKWTTGGISGLSQKSPDVSASAGTGKSSTAGFGTGASNWSVPTQSAPKMDSIPGKNQNIYGVTLPETRRTQSGAGLDAGLQRAPAIQKAPQVQTMAQIYQERLGQAFKNPNNNVTTPPVSAKPSHSNQPAVKSTTVGKGRVSDPNDYLNR